MGFNFLDFVCLLQIREKVQKEVIMPKPSSPPLLAIGSIKQRTYRTHSGGRRLGLVRETRSLASASSCCLEYRSRGLAGSSGLEREALPLLLLAFFVSLPEGFCGALLGCLLCFGFSPALHAKDGDGTRINPETQHCAQKTLPRTYVKR